MAKKAAADKKRSLEKKRKEEERKKEEAKKEEEKKKVRAEKACAGREERSDEALRILRDMAHQFYEQLLLWRLASLVAVALLDIDARRRYFCTLRLYYQLRHRF